MSQRAKPIIFQGNMIQAIRGNRKTQARRVMKPQPPEWVKDLGYDCFTPKGHISGRGMYKGEPAEKFFKCPFGIRGDKLWIRETCAFWEDPNNGQDFVIYRAGGKKEFPNVRDLKYPGHPFNNKWLPSIFMPRWASRLTLEITNIRGERVQNITEEDARAEGIIDGGCLSCGESEPCGCDNPQPDARDSFIYLWDSTNAKRGYGWEISPWVWVIEFKALPDATEDHEANP